MVKRGPKQGSNAIERKEFILNYLKESGAFGISASVIKQLAEKWEVTVRQIQKDIGAILDKFALPNKEQLPKKFTMSFERNLKEAHKLLKHEDATIRSRAISALNQTIKEYTEFMERFGIKEKVADKLAVSGESIILNITDPNDKYPSIEDSEDTRESKKKDSKLQSSK